MHPSTFEYLKPTENQINDMQAFRSEATDFSKTIENLIPDGPDKTYIIRKFREVCMWANVAITRLPDGTPRT